MRHPLCSLLWLLVGNRLDNRLCQCRDRGRDKGRDKGRDLRTHRFAALLTLVSFVGTFALASQARAAGAAQVKSAAPPSVSVKTPALKGAGEKPELKTATFAAGCFWGTEEFFRKMPGVVSTDVGYTGGTLANPKYEDTQDSKSGHAESVEVVYDPKKVTYEHLLDQFFKMHDPTTPNRQGNDAGSQYRSAIFYHDDTQKKEAEAFVKKVNASHAWKAPVATEIAPAKKFWMAEDYHQHYLVKNSGGYDNHYLRPISFENGSQKAVSK